MRCLLIFAFLFPIILAEEASDVAQPGSTPGQSNLIHRNEEGKLVYVPYTEKGDRIPDFSYCGYGGGLKSIPDVPVKAILGPLKKAGDDTSRIQAALDKVSKLPLQPDGTRGAVLLKKGTYHCSGTLNIRKDGVVLRGEGTGENGTLLISTARRQEPLISIGNTSSDALTPQNNFEREITDVYVPVGACMVTVKNTQGFKAGSTVSIIRRGNKEWIHAIGMDRIKPRPGDPKSTKQWEPFEMRSDRRVVTIQGNKITFDAPITCSIEAQWGGGYIVPCRDNRIQNCGIENLEAVCQIPDRPSEKGKNSSIDEDHATYLVRFQGVANAWARRLVSRHFYHGVAEMGRHGKWITIEDCQALEPVSQITGGRRYAYHISGAQLCLIQRCLADKARHAFVFGARVSGPNVFLDCRSTNDKGSSEPHHRWSTGGLYDNVHSSIAIQDRQWMGSGHGWSGANYIVWNCRGQLICEKPPTAQNFAIGFVGKRRKGAFNRPGGWWESQGTQVEPQSLYKAQREERLSPGSAE